MTEQRRKKAHAGDRNRDEMQIPDVLQFESLAFICQLPGLLLKHGSDLLSKVSSRALWTFKPTELTISSQCEAASSVSICINFRRSVFQHLICTTPSSLIIESPEFSLACKHLRKRDTVTIYVNSNMSFGVITESPYHTKNSIVASMETEVDKQKSQCAVENFNDIGMRDAPLVMGPQMRIGVHEKTLDHFHTNPNNWEPTNGVRISGGMFQRMIRDYRASGKKINIQGNGSYVLFELDQADSLHRTDKIQPSRTKVTTSRGDIFGGPVGILTRLPSCLPSTDILFFDLSFFCTGVSLPEPFQPPA